MKNTIKINHLSRKEKLMIMEAIWDDLQKDNESTDSPKWHNQVLRETEERYKEGYEKVLDWQDVKKELRKRFE